MSWVFVLLRGTTSQLGCVWYHVYTLTILAVRRAVHEACDKSFHSGHDVRAVGWGKMGDVRAGWWVLVFRFLDEICL
jgi:hypothetical protein